MKKLSILGFLLALFLLAGCTTQNNPQNPGEPQKPNGPALADFYAYPENAKYVYEGEGNEFASYTLMVDYLKDNRAQIRSNNGGTETVKVLENKNGALTVLLSRGEAYYREDLTQSSSLNSNGEILLKEPIVKGTAWTLPDNRQRSITNVDVDVTTPSGNYKAVEVTTEGNNSKTIDYYAKGVGLVKSVFSSNGTEVTSTLSKLEKDVPLVQNVKFYYPNINDGKLYYVIRALSFKTNDLTKQALENEVRNLPQANLGKVIGPDVKIKSLYLNQDNMVYVDFSKEFQTEMNAGAGYEAMILQSIANTLGAYYGAEKVYLTVEGNPYASGHISYEKGEAIPVDYKDSVELKQ